MRIGFYGGSFDPPHAGHLAVAETAAAQFQLTRILLAPTGRQPLKDAGSCASFADRLAMVSLLCGEGGGSTQLQASAIDAPLEDGGPNFTVDTLVRLRTQGGPSEKIFVVVGADAFLDLRRWRDPDGLLRAAEWVVVTRPGFSLQRLEHLCLTTAQRARVHLQEGLAHPASATAIRARLRAGQACGDVLPDSVEQYIRDHHLYGT